MKYPVKALSVVAACLVLAGCSTAGLLNRGRGPDAAAVQSGSNLTMPPDLRLPQPGSGQMASYQPPAAAASTGDDIYGGGAAPVTPRRTIGGTKCPNGTMAADVYACYGISKLKPNGTPKTTAEMSMELRAAVVAEKRRANPGYGTFRNFGELFN